MLATSSSSSNNNTNIDNADDDFQMVGRLSDQESKALLKLAPGRRMSSIRMLFIIVLVILYTAIVLTYIICMRYQVFASNPWVLYMCKPTPLALLLILLPLYAEYNRKTLPYAVWIYLGVVCCLAGDIISMFQTSIPYSRHDTDPHDFYAPQGGSSSSAGGPTLNSSSDSESNNKDSKLFIFSMMCYMIGKSFYTVSFIVGVGKEFRFKILHSVPFYAFGAMVIVLVYSEIGNDFAYMVVYVFVECTMGWRALALTSAFPGSDRAKLLLWLSVVGSAMLMAADTLSIYNAYYEPLRGAYFFASGIYYLGQILIAFSIPRRLSNSDYWLYHFTYINPFVN